MAPATVKTVPPWVVQRPPPSLLPQHNYAPADPRHGRGRSDGSRDGLGSRSGGSTSTNDAGREEAAAAAAGVADDLRAPSAGTAAPGSAPGTAASTTAPPTAIDGAPDTAASAPDESPDRSLGRRLSLLFRRKEGRKWDHLRSAEPVIVPQFHVVPGTTASGASRHGRGASQGGASSGLQSPVGLGRREAEDLGLDGGAAPEQHPPPPPQQPQPQPQHRHHGDDDEPDRQEHPWWYNPETQWRGFIESSRYPHLPNEKSEIINDEEMARLNPDFGFHTVLRPRVGDDGGGFGHLHHRHQRRSSYLTGAGGGGGGGGGSGSKGDKPAPSLLRRIWETLLHHPLGPLACRLTVLSTSIVALVVAATIFRREHFASLGSLGNGDRASGDINSVWLADRQQERTQIIVAIVVDVVAIPYIGYITVDDYTGKPLGLRPPQARIRLILTDMFFIIFKSASTALGFEAMIYFNSEANEGLLRTLGAFELIGLISWTLTLTINIFREIERLGG